MYSVIFDALNDTRNLKTAVEAAKEAKAEVEHSVEVQGCLVYTVGGPHTIAEFGKLAKELDAMGVDSICIKDMSGLLKPYDAYELVKEFRKHSTNFLFSYTLTILAVLVPWLT